MSKTAAEDILKGWPDILTPTDVAALYSVRPGMLHRWDKQLRPFRTPTGQRRYRKETVAAAIASRYTPRAS